MFLSQITNEDDLIKAIYKEMSIGKSKSKVKQVADEFMENGVCHPFVPILLQRIRYALKFDVWRVFNGTSSSVELRNISVEDIHELFKIIKAYPRIRLDIEVDDAGAEIIAHYLESGSPLHSLKVRNNHLTIRGMPALAKSLVSNTALLTLMISDDEVGDQFAVALAQYLPRNRTLRSLYLQITDVGGQAILDALQQNTTLKIFYGGQRISRHLQQEIEHQLEENKMIEAKKKQLRAFSEVYTPSHSAFSNPRSSQSEQKTAAFELDAAKAISKRLRRHL